MAWRYYIRLPLFLVAFVWLLTANLWTNGKQAWRWTVDGIRDIHDDCKRNFKETP